MQTWDDIPSIIFWLNWASTHTRCHNPIFDPFILIIIIIILFTENDIKKWWWKK